jgi:hypothetical protein
MNSSKTQVNKKMKSFNKRLNALNRRLTNNAPVAISTRSSNTGKDYYSTKGKERVSNVTALNSGFNIVDVFINPANTSLFPWLSGIAKKYDLYHFKRLRFTYVPSLPTSEEGNVYIGLDYNTLDPPPNSSSELCQLSHWTMNVVWKPSNLAIDTNGIGWQYTRSGPVANADYKTYDIGRLFLATEGISYTGTVGYIEVEYDVEFKRRQPDYTSSVIPTTDVYTPGAFIYANVIPAGSQSTAFHNSSFSNNSIITIDKSTGTFTVTKAVKAICITFNYDTVLASSSSTVGTIYNGTSLVSNSVTGGVVFLDPTRVYNLYNAGSNPATIFVSLVILDNF